MGRAVGQDTILPANMTNHYKALIPMGAGLVMGLEGRPFFTRPLEVSRHLQRLRAYLCQRGCLMRIIMTALAPLECHHPRLGQSLWRLGVMRPQCLHAHAAPAGVLVCPAGRPGEVSLPSVASSPCANGGAGSGRRAPLVRAPPPSPACA